MTRKMQLWWIRWWRSWRGGWLGRLLRVHSPSGHATGDCWCSSRTRKQSTAYVTTLRRRPGPCCSRWRVGHSMYCRRYVGPLTHEWVWTDWNGTFGGVDHHCSCGGWFRQGGLAGHGDGSENAEPVCPHVAETWASGDR